jgi:hypothetical protein
VLTVARDLHGVFHTDAACLLVDATVVIGCGLLMALFAPLLDGLNAHLSILHGDVRWCFPAATWGQMKLGHLSADGVRGGNIAPSFDGASGGISR